MTDEQRSIASACFTAAEHDTIPFPTIVGRLIDAGFEGYYVDLRRGEIAYYLPSGQSVTCATEPAPAAESPAFDVAVVRAAIRDAQTKAPGYTYRGFCARVVAAGCVGYLASFPGRRVVYLGRTGETHTELFP